MKRKTEEVDIRKIKLREEYGWGYIRGVWYWLGKGKPRFEPPFWRHLPRKVRAEDGEEDD